LILFLHSPPPFPPVHPCSQLILLKLQIEQTKREAHESARTASERETAANERQHKVETQVEVQLAQLEQMTQEALAYQALKNAEEHLLTSTLDSSTPDGPLVEIGLCKRQLKGEHLWNFVEEMSADMSIYVYVALICTFWCFICWTLLFVAPNSPKSSQNTS